MTLVGWIGLGQMGHPMALRVLAAGHDLVGHSRRHADHVDVIVAGGRLTHSPVVAVSAAQIVCVNLYSEAQLREVMFAGGVLAAIPAGTVVAIHSTVGAPIMQEIADARDDIAVIDAAFSGTAEDAAAGRIALMVGGDASALAAAEPVLRAYADYIAHVGPIGAGMTLKLLNNMLFGAQLALARDALRAAATAGISPADATRIFARSSGGSYAMNILARGGDLEGVLAAVGRYVEKDVATARASLTNLDLGTLDDATHGFVAQSAASEHG